jgi:hypothetical protein
VHDHGRSPNVENRAKDYLAVIANMPFYLFNQTKKLQNRVTLDWSALSSSR